MVIRLCLSFLGRCCISYAIGPESDKGTSVFLLFKAILVGGMLTVIFEDF